MTEAETGNDDLLQRRVIEAETGNDDLLQRRVIEAGIRIGFLVLVVAWCIQIVRPFVLVIAWGVIIAVATYSPYRRIEKTLGGRRRLAATPYVLLAFVLLLLPSIVLTGTLINGARTLAGKLKEGVPTLPPPRSGCDMALFQPSSCADEASACLVAEEQRWLTTEYDL